MNGEKLEQLKQAHGDIYVLTADEDQIVVRMPTIPEFDRFSQFVADETKASKALKQLVLDCLVHPSADDYKAMIARRPGLFLAFGKQLTKICGASVEAETKKV